MDKPTCTIDGCDKPRLARQKCRKHYRQEVPDAYRHRVEKRTASECITCGASFEHVRKAKSGKCRSCLNAAKTGNPKTKWPSCPVRFLGCPRCLALFAAHGSRKYCTPECSKEASAERFGYRNRPCKGCGDSLGRVSLDWYCDGCKATQSRDTRRAHKARRRAQIKASPVLETVRPIEVFNRDNWTCGVCHEPVDSTLTYPDRMSASLDHVIPLARGGHHTYANTQCSHLVCNMLKSDTILT